MPLAFEAAILSRMRSPVTSRSNWANDSRTLRVSRPTLVVVLNAWVNRVAAVPTAEALTALSAERDELNAREATMQTDQKAEGEQLDRLRRDLERAQTEISRFTADDKEARLAQDDRTRVLLHISKVRDTLDKFRDAVIRRHLVRIEALVLDSFQQLLRKKTLVVDLRIDPESFQLALTGRDGKRASVGPLHAHARSRAGVKSIRLPVNATVQAPFRVHRHLKLWASIGGDFGAC